MWWTMSSKLEQAIERLSAVVDTLEVLPQEAALAEASAAPDQNMPNQNMKAEIVKIRGLVDEAMAIIAKSDTISDKGAG